MTSTRKIAIAGGVLYLISHVTSIAALILAAALPHEATAQDQADNRPRGQMRLTALSPDTGIFAFEAERTFREPTEIWVVETAEGSAPRHLGIGMGPAWSPDSRQLAFFAPAQDGLQLWLWDRSTGTRRQLTHVKGGIRPSFYASPFPAHRLSFRLSWSPDGRAIAFAAMVEQSPRTRSDSIAIILDQHSPGPAVWAGVFRHTFGGWRLDRGAMAERMLDASAAQAMRDEVPQLLLADARTGAVRELTRGRDGAFDPDFSPDGRTIVFVSADGEPMLASRLRNSSLALIEVDGSNRRSLLAGKGRRYAPRFSRDGSLIAFGFQQDPYASSRTLIYDTRARRTITDTAAVRSLLRDAFPTAGRFSPLVAIRGTTVELRTRPPRRILDLSAAPTAADANSASTPSTMSGSPPPRRLTWMSARGHRVSGRLRYPRDFQAGRKYPLVVDPYAEWQTPDTLTNAGYLLFTPNPRAPHDPGDDSEAYRKLAVDSSEVALAIMQEDVMRGVDTLVAEGIVDTTRMALVGFSNGAGVVNYLLPRTNRFRCAVAQSPTSGDLTAKFLLDPDGEYILSWLDGRAPWDAPHAYVALSPVYQAHRISVPVMYAFGEAEAIPFIASAVEMYAALRRLRKPVVLVKYPGQGHGLTGAARADLGRRARQFIDECTR